MGAPSREEPTRQRQQLVEMVDDGLRLACGERASGIAETTSTTGTLAPLAVRRSTSLSPTMRACVASPPARPIVCVRWPGSGFDMAKVSRPAIAAEIVIEA